MKPRTKFLAGGLLILGSAGVLMASSIKETGQYYLTPGELGAKVANDPTFRATTLLAKCASRYENAPDKYKNAPGYRNPAAAPAPAVRTT